MAGALLHIHDNTSTNVVALLFVHVHFIPDDGHEDRKVDTIPLTDLCEMQCSLECMQVACQRFKYNEAA